ncbi:MAG: AAA family ATPase [Candidatus Thiodiazotropha sp.]|jgi:MoxR-like ATPase
MEIKQAADNLKRVVKQATAGLVEREIVIDLIILAAVAQEHLLIIGPPGTAKSAAVRRVATALGGNYFEYLLGRFTEPSELFGPVDLRKLQEGIIETATDGMLPEAEIAFLDEVFLGSTAILNTLLTLLNERKFKRGHTRLDCPLRVCVGASNQLPEEETLHAFADRFLVHAFVEPVPDFALEDLLQQGRKTLWSNSETETENGLQSLDQLTRHAISLDSSPIQERLAEAIRLLRKEGIDLSDRRIVKSQALINAAAALAGREIPGGADLWPLIYVIPTSEAQQTAREVLRDLLEATENNTLSAAAEHASKGPLARAQRLLEKGEQLLNTPAEQRSKLEVEALGREIDAGFPLDGMPEPLRKLREQLLVLCTEIGTENAGF